MEMKVTSMARQTVTIKKNFFEYQAWESQHTIIGIDEVGRGCFAGPVVAAAVILPINKLNKMLKDSKIMTPEERIHAFAWIQKHCIYGVGIAHHRLIDEHNIVQATRIAMIKATLNTLYQISTHPSAIVIDAMSIDLSQTAFQGIPIYHFVRGESKSSSIAAASIVAKVTRDYMMNILEKSIPGYGWSANKGYGTIAHRTALQSYQHSILHRMRFLKNLQQQENNLDEQLTLPFDMFQTQFDQIDHLEGDTYESGEILCRSD